MQYWGFSHNVFILLHGCFPLEGAYFGMIFFRCKTLTVAQKKFTLHSLPTVLTIQMKRFVCAMDVFVLFLFLPDKVQPWSKTCFLP